MKSSLKDDQIQSSNDRINFLEKKLEDLTTNYSQLSVEEENELKVSVLTEQVKPLTNPIHSLDEMSNNLLKEKQELLEELANMKMQVKLPSGEQEAESNKIILTIIIEINQEEKIIDLNKDLSHVFYTI